MAKDKPIKLTHKQEKFCKEFLKDLNATQAAIRSGYSKDSARQIGADNLSKPYIAEHISLLQEKRAKRHKITPDKVLAELAYIAFSRMTDVAKWNGTSVTLKSSEELEEHAVAAISEVSEGKEVVKVKNHNKTAALTLLMKHLGMDNPGGDDIEGFEFDITIRKRVEEKDPD